MLGQFKDWVTHPWREDMKFTTIAVLVVIFIIACVWATDGIRILSNALKEGTA